MKTRVMQNESDHPRNNEQESRVAQIPALFIAAVYECADHRTSASKNTPIMHAQRNHS